MDPRKERAIAERARTQLGLLTTAQILSAGVSRSTLKRRTDDGTWTRVGPRTILVGGAPAGPRVVVMAACLDLGGVASHRTAAWLHGLAPRPPLIDVTVPKGRSTASAPPGVRVHTSTNLPLDDVITVDGIPTTSVARTMLGLAALVGADLRHDDLVATVEAAVQTRLASDSWLWWLLEQRRCRGRDGVVALERVLAERARLGPTESWLERELLRILEAAGLPLPVVQRRVQRRGAFVARVDFLYEGERIVLEAMGYASHRTRAQLNADAARTSDLQLLGLQVHQITYDQIVTTPDRVVRVVAEALARARHPAARRDPVLRHGVVTRAQPVPQNGGRPIRTRF